MVKPSNKKDETKITRISATDTPAKKSATPVKTKPSKKETAPALVTAKKERASNPLTAVAEYFKGAWYELRQVRWPDRRSTWGMTGALIVFTLFFVIIILILDYGFSQLFKLILGSN